MRRNHIFLKALIKGSASYPVPSNISGIKEYSFTVFLNLNHSNVILCVGQQFLIRITYLAKKVYRAAYRGPVLEY